MGNQSKEMPRSDRLEAVTVQIVRCRQCQGLFKVEVKSEQFMMDMMRLADEVGEGAIQSLSCQLNGFQFVCPQCGLNEWIDLTESRHNQDS